ncbi:MAG: glycosyltransferase WbsX family protein [Candidatus Eremiobacteraeota bacterium]|nr:glycosyltransferase WbsX family protein [Candidatus Eremiobacteraeota bacterium]
MLMVDGREANIARDPLDTIWNADELVGIRAAMARGERPPSCGSCWMNEERGAVSRRLLLNSGYRIHGGGLAVEQLASEGAATGYRLERKPDWFIFELGNVCTLKCRSCNAHSSSKIGTDPVQVAWSGATPVAASNGTAWFKQIDSLVDTIAAAGHERAMLSLLGGEPFLIKQTWELLDALVARGLAPTLYVGIVTNGQQRSARLAELVPQFRGFNVNVSVDGYGPLNGYLRHGSDWATVSDTLGWLRTIPNVDVAVCPTFQNVNVLGIVDLVRFVDDLDVPLSYNVLVHPERLAPANLPPMVRRVAARRLRSFLDSACKAPNRSIVRAYCEVLEEAGDAFDPELFAEFATFTNDLDADRGESLDTVAPELVALIRASGVAWPKTRRHVPAATAPSFDCDAVLARMDRTVSPDDVIFTTGDTIRRDWYFESAASQLAEIDRLLREQGHSGLAASRAVADYASHYGRMTRALRAALPHAAVYACDIDAGAIQFCAEHLGALPVATGWRPDEDALPGDLDAVVCISLLTHTPLEHWRHTLRAWLRMLRPGGVAAFTYLPEAHLRPWLAHEIEHYGSYPDTVREATAAEVREDGFGFTALSDFYGGEPLYGIAFATGDVVRRELTAAGFESIVLAGDADGRFAQDLVLARRPEANAGIAARPAVQRDVAIVALYDPRCYAPESSDEGDFAQSTWAQLTAADPPVPLPADLGFADPRVAEMRESQVALARAHGIDAFAYLWMWGAGGPRWDAALRDLLASGRPDFPFCLMIGVDDDATVEPSSAPAVFDRIVDALADPRALRIDGRPLLIVRDLARVTDDHAVTSAWRRAAAERGIGDLHLCAVEPPYDARPGDLGFDSFLAASAPAPETTPWPAHRYFRRVTSAPAGEEYEFSLTAAIDATRRHGEQLVFVDAWNDWTHGRYLEPDDRNGRAALLATKRAARGPASGLVLLRRLRDALGTTEPAAADVLRELDDVMTFHERSRDHLLAAVEVALERKPPGAAALLRDVPVPSRQLPPSAAHAHLDIIGNINTAVGEEPTPIGPGVVRMMGWAHIDDCAPDTVDVFIALEAADATNDRVFRGTRFPRPDVAAAYAGFPDDCGFAVDVDAADLAAGAYQVAIVQRTRAATFRDATGVTVMRGEAACSNG